MIIGAMNNPHKNLVEEIYRIGEMNFDYLELTIEHPRALPEVVEKRRHEVMDAVSSYNLGILAHLPWYFSIAHPYSRVQKAINTEIASAMRAAASLGAKSMTIHTELSISPSAQGRKRLVENSAKTLKGLHKKARGFGIDLLLETVAPKSLRFGEYAQIFSRVDMGMTLDVGHAELSYPEGFGGFWQKFRGRIRHLHMHDVKGSENHLPIGAGKVDFGKIVKALKDGGYDSTITLEVHSQDPHYIEHSRERVESLWYGKKKFGENKQYLRPQGSEARIAGK